MQSVNILIVDDEQIVHDSIRKHLRRIPEYNLFFALSVEDGLKILETERIHIVLTDLMMPEIDGLELLNILKKRDEKILAIMITGYATINSALQAMQLGAFDYLAKPFTKIELHKIVRRAYELAIVSNKATAKETIAPKNGDNGKLTGKLKGIGQHSWFMKMENGLVLIGLERPFLIKMGIIESVYLPEPSDELRQGSVYFQAFSSDLRSESLLSPLSGTVKEVNQNVIDNPNEALRDPYEQGWLIKLEPDKFDEEIKILGL